MGKIKRNGQNLSNQLGLASSPTAPINIGQPLMDSSSRAALLEFVTEIQETYDAFNYERNLYPAATRIDAALKQAFVDGSVAITAEGQGDLTALKGHLRESINKLELSEVLLTYGDVSNPIDLASFLVRQQYVDFLDREPDQSGGDFWTNEIATCGSDAQCVELKRTNVSAAFFLSIEFQQTGYLVHRLYKSSYGRLPMLREFLPDKSSIAGGVIVGEPGWESKLAGNKQAFVERWVLRPEFHALYDGMTDQQYVDTLVANMGITITNTERNEFTQDLTNGVSRGEVLSKMIDNSSFVHQEFNSAFVLMEYFGYLGRDPDAPGFNFWLGKLNQFGGNFVQADMVKAFLSSGEYRQRFGQ